MSYRGHLRALMVLGTPLIGGHLAQFAVGLTDTVMLGWYSVEALASVVLGTTFFFVAFILGSGFSIAVMPMVAEAAASGYEPRIRRVTRMGLWLSVAYAVLLYPLFWWSGSIFLAMGQDEQLAATAQTYCRIIGLGLLPALVTNVLKSYLAALERTQVVFWVTLLATVVNALVNYALIFGNWGAPELGVVGAAIASISVHTVSFVGVLLYALKVFPNHALFARIFKPDPEILKDVFRLGLPIGVTAVLEVGLFAASTLMMGWLGTVTLAAHGIAINIAGLTFMLHLGLSNAATVRAGNALGRRDPEHLARGARTAILVSIAFAVFATLLMVSVPAFLISLFLSPTEPAYDEILLVGVQLLYLAALFQFVDGMQAIALGLLRGILDTQRPMILAAISYWGIGLTSGYVFGFVFDWGSSGVWLGLVLGLACAAVLLMWRFWKGKLDALRQECLPTRDA